MRSSPKTRPLRLLAASLLACLIAANPAGEKIKGWGETIDPDGDCKFTLEKDRLTIKVPGTLHDLSVEANNLSAPRVVQEIQGDWLARVQISGKVSHQGDRVSPRYLAYHGAGIVAWKDDQTYVRLERAGLINPEGQPVHYVNFELRKNGLHAGGEGMSIPDKPTFLRLSRRLGKFVGSFSADGKEWTDFKPLDAELPQDLKVGVVAVNTSTEAFEAQFAKFAVVRTRAAVKGKP